MYEYTELYAVEKPSFLVFRTLRCRIFNALVLPKHGYDLSTEYRFNVAPSL